MASLHGIAALQGALRADPAASVVGFEANVGFVMGFAAGVTGGGGGPPARPDAAPCPQRRADRQYVLTQAVKPAVTLQ